jgi:hypothetical protein
MSAGGRSDVDSARVEALLAEGMSIRDIAEETGIPRPAVHRLKKKPGGTLPATPLGRQRTSRNNYMTMLSRRPNPWGVGKWDGAPGYPLRRNVATALPFAIAPTLSAQTSEKIEHIAS